MPDVVAQLKARYEDSENVWFFVKPNYRIIQFNKKAASNSFALHHKKISQGDSILDYARDTTNRIDAEFITCFGKSAAGQLVTHEQKIEYQGTSITARSTYVPVYSEKVLLGISIEVEIL